MYSFDWKDEFRQDNFHKNIKQHQLWKTVGAA